MSLLKHSQGQRARQGQGIGHNQILKQNLLAVTSDELLQKLRAECLQNVLSDHLNITEEFVSLDEMQESSTHDLNTIENFNDENLGYKMQGDKGFDIPDDRKSAFKTIANEYEKLTLQLASFQLSDNERKMAEYMIYSIDGDGFIKDLDNVIHNLSEVTAADTIEVTALYEKLKSKLEPAGILSTGYQDCLLTQLDRSPKEGNHALIEKILKDDFKNFLNGKIDDIQAKYRLNDDQVLKNAFETIQSFNPKPLHSKDQASPLRTNSKEADYIVHLNEKGDFVARSAKETKPFFKSTIHAELDRLKREPVNDRERDEIEFIRSEFEHLNEVRQLLIERDKQIEKVVSYVLNEQKSFILSGNSDDLKPLLQKDIAEQFSIHPSTVSRIASNKIIQLPDGATCTVRGMFQEGIEINKEQAQTQNEGIDTSRTLSIGDTKNMIRNIMSETDNKLNKAQLHKALQEKGVSISPLRVGRIFDSMAEEFQKAPKESNQPEVIAHTSRVTQHTLFISRS